MAGSSLCLLAVTLVALPGARWLYLMRRVRIPKDRRLFLASNAAAAVCGIAALATDASPFTKAGAGVAVVAALAFLALNAASGQARGEPAVRVGDAMLEFDSCDDDGRPFSTTLLGGRPYVVKFFRGHWCPYCVAELARWKEMQPLLDRFDVAVVTVCADTADKIRSGRHRHGLGAIMLADPDLRVTDLFGLRNPRGFALKSGIIVPLPIPTTILVDARGIVRWIDQADDYMTRSEPSRVMEALGEALGAPTPRGPRGRTEAGTVSADAPVPLSA
ncbi:MAG TPA: peroxiredoxin family protein [Candidatus Binatia bacterium]